MQPDAHRQGILSSYTSTRRWTILARHFVDHTPLEGSIAASASRLSPCSVARAGGKVCSVFARHGFRVLIQCPV